MFTRASISTCLPELCFLTEWSNTIVSCRGRKARPGRARPAQHRKKWAGLLAVSLHPLLMTLPSRHRLMPSLLQPLTLPLIPALLPRASEARTHSSRASNTVTHSCRASDAVCHSSSSGGSKPSMALWQKALSFRTGSLQRYNLMLLMPRHQPRQRQDQTRMLTPRHLQRKVKL